MLNYIELLNFGQQKLWIFVKILYLAGRFYENRSKSHNDASATVMNSAGSPFLRKYK